MIFELMWICLIVDVDLSLYDPKDTTSLLLRSGRLAWLSTSPLLPAPKVLHGTPCFRVTTPSPHHA